MGRRAQWGVCPSPLIYGIYLAPGRLLSEISRVKGNSARSIVGIGIASQRLMSMVANGLQILNHLARLEVFFDWWQESDQILCKSPPMYVGHTHPDKVTASWELWNREGGGSISLALVALWGNLAKKPLRIRMYITYIVFVMHIYYTLAYI